MCVIKSKVHLCRCRHVIKKQRRKQRSHLSLSSLVTQLLGLFHQFIWIKKTISHELPRLIKKKKSFIKVTSKYLPRYSCFSLASCSPWASRLSIMASPRWAFFHVLLDQNRNLNKKQKDDWRSIPSELLNRCFPLFWDGHYGQPLWFDIYAAVGWTAMAFCPQEVWSH